MARHKPFEIDLRGGFAALTPQERKERAEAERLQMARKILQVKDDFRMPYKALQALRVRGGIHLIPPEYVLQAEALRLATCLDIVQINVSRTIMLDLSFSVRTLFCTMKE
jgi:hypothetical protein